MTSTELTRSEPMSAPISDVIAMIEQQREQAERRRTQPAEVIQAMRSAGLFRLWTPREYGGDETPLASFMQTVEEVSRADAAAGWTFANLAAGDVLTAFLPPEGAAAIYAHGPDVAIPGSVAPAGRATPVEGGYRLSGRWPLASGCEHGDWVVGCAIVFEGGAPRISAAGAPDFQACFLPRELCEVEDTWHSLGLRGSGSAHFRVADAFVPLSHAFSLFEARPHVEGRLYRIGILGLYSMAVTSVLLGTARRAIDAFVELAKAKTPTLSQTGLASRPTIHAEVARAEARLGAARSYLYAAAAAMESAAETSQALPDAVEATRRLACANAGEACEQVVDAMFKLAGSTPVYSGDSLERCLRDVHTAAQHLAVSPVWWEKTGQYFFGQGLGMP